MHPQVCPRFCFAAMFHVERFGRAAFKTVFHFANPIYQNAPTML